MARIIIINRAWKEEFSIPRWKTGRTFVAEFFKKFCEDFKNLYVGPSGMLDINKLDYEQTADKTLSPEFYLLKIHIDICLMNMGEERDKFYKLLADFFLKLVDYRDKALFLFHAHEDFAIKIPALCTENTWYEQFKGGTEPIYAGHEGILIDQDYDPRVSEFNPTTGLFSLESGKVERIWNYYFYRTSQKLMQMREHILRAQIPNISEEGKQLSRGIVCNLLENLKEPVTACTPVAAVPYNLDFSRGRDLPELRGKVLTDSLIRELKKFVQEDQSVYPRLNRFLETMVSALTQN